MQSEIADLPKFLILRMPPANKNPRYNVTNGWAHTQIDPTL